MTKIEKAIKWFTIMGIRCINWNDRVLIFVKDCAITISNDEIEYRAEMYDKKDFN